MSPIRMERVEAALRTVISFTEAFNHRDLPAMLELISNDCLFEAPSPTPDGTVYKGKLEIARYWQEFFDRTPLARMKIEESTGYGLRCIIRWRCDFTDASGASSHSVGVDLFRVHDGLITEHLSYTKS